MAYSELTTEQKATLDAWMALFRASVGELARANNHLDAVNIEYTGAAGDVLALLQGSDVIPNSSGLTGAEPMTKDQVVTVVSYIQGVLAYNTAAHRGNIARACGEANLIG
jgi:hypothetical protein